MSEATSVSQEETTVEKKRRKKLNMTFALILCAIWDPRRTVTAFVRQKKLDGLDLNILRDRIGKNTVVSSFAFRLPLCNLASVAGTATRNEIISVLDIQTLTQTKTCFSSLFPTLGPLLETDLTMLNKIYVDYKSNINTSFIVNASVFGLTVSMIGFDYKRDAVTYVNDEFSSKTYMRLRDVVDINDIDKESSILLVNGFHYKGTWENVFKSPSKSYKRFHNGHKTMEVEMMQTTTQCSYMDDPPGRFKAISFRLSQFGVYVTFVLPYANSSIVSLLELISNNPHFLEKVNEGSKWKFVDVEMPKFKIKTVLDWTPYLKEIGLNLTTNVNNTGLNGILKSKQTINKNMYVSKAKQKLFIEVDEGRPAGKIMTYADTPLVRPELARDLSMAPVALEEFKVDGPIYFSVTLLIKAEKLKGGKRRHQLFSGIYYGPEE